MSYSVRQLSGGARKSKQHKQTEATLAGTMMREHALKATCTYGSMLGRSNLDCILEYMTPKVQCQYRSKTANAECVGERENAQNENAPFYSLGDLWQSFDEWSAYGVGVPLKLPTGEMIVQYYVPYLSALQIYMQPGTAIFPNKRRLGDDSDWSDASDLRETSSDFGSDNETDKALARLQIRAEQWESSSSTSSASSEQNDRLHGDLVFEYFERCSPYGRAPLSGKICELSNRFLPLPSLRSNELSSASWLAVAWYPIYRIPTGPTMSDLSTCFLTFHSLWTPPYLPGSVDFCSGKLEQEQWLRDHSAWRMKAGMLELPAFGLASYKLRGPFWASAVPADKQRASLLASSAGAWVKQLRVQHPDYEFFSSREAMRFDR